MGKSPDYKTSSSRQHSELTPGVPQRHKGRMPHSSQEAVPEAWGLSQVTEDEDKQAGQSIRVRAFWEETESV